MMSDERLLDFCRALVSTVRSGLTLSDAFETLAKSSRHGRVIAGAAKLTAGGSPLHEAFKAQKIFPPVFIALLRAGEEGGKIDEFLELYADCLEVRVEFRRRIERLLVYPAFTVILAGGLFLLASLKVVPLVMEPLLKSGAALPAQAFWFTNLAERLYERWPLIIMFASVSLLALRAFLRSGAGRKVRGLAGHWLPLCRFATEEARLYSIYTTMGLLLKAGLPLGMLMDVLLQFSQDDLITKRRFRRAAEMLSAGTSFSGSVAGLMPEEDRHSMEIAEKAGRLDETMLCRAKLHYDRHLHRLKLLVTGFTISTMIAIALICFALIMTIVWPVISVLGGMKGGGGSGLGLAGPAAALNQALPANNGSARRKKSTVRMFEDAKTEMFNKKHGKEVSDFIQKYGMKARQDQNGEGQTGRSGQKKMLRPVSPIGKIRFKEATPTSIQPLDIHSH